MALEAKLEDGIGTLKLNNPPVNILTREVMGSLRQELTRFAAEPALRVLVLTAEGKHFSAGADVGEHMPPEFEEMIPEFIETIAAIGDFPLPVIAAVRGRCLGGGFELILPVDLVVAGEGATFGQPEILLGVLPPAACALLEELVSPGLAAEIVFTGDSITAQQAFEVGLIRRVVPDDQVEGEALELAGRIARHSAASLRSTKRALRGGSAERRADALRQAGDVYVGELMQTEDAVEGLRSFLEKRKPEWKHR